MVPQEGKSGKTKLVIQERIHKVWVTLRVSCSAMHTPLRKVVAEAYIGNIGSNIMPQNGGLLEASEG